MPLTPLNEVTSTYGLPILDTSEARSFAGGGRRLFVGLFHNVPRPQTSVCTGDKLANRAGLTAVFRIPDWFHFPPSTGFSETVNIYANLLSIINTRTPHIAQPRATRVSKMRKKGKILEPHYIYAEPFDPFRFPIKD